MNRRDDAQSAAAMRLAAAGIESARADARVLMACAGEDMALFESFVARREKHEPVAYITGHKEFWSLDFDVGPGVLVPRPETETLIEEALKEFPDRNAPLDMLDLGAGSGCILIAALSEFPNARGIALERSPQALNWLERNIAKHRMSGRCTIWRSDWRKGLEGRFDAIFANPPYVAENEWTKLPPDVARYEPIAALIGGADGLAAYNELATRLPGWLKPGGKAFLETGKGQANRVSAILESAGLKTERIALDLAGIARCIVARLAA